MAKPDLLEQSVTRVELDQRSREARLRLERVERLMVVHPVSPQSLLRRFLYRIRTRVCFSEQVRGRSARPAVSGGRGRTVPGGSGDATDGLISMPPLRRLNCLEGARNRPLRSDRSRGREAWNYWCGRGDSNPHALSDSRF
jgi:hypothetical protein